MVTGPETARAILGDAMALSAPAGHPAAELLAENFDPAVLIDAASGRFVAANGAASTTAFDTPRSCTL
jgi:hypothetical protein